MNKNKKNEKSKEQKAFELIDIFLKSIPQNEIKFDEFSKLEEITNAKMDYNLMKDILEQRINQIKEIEIKTIKDI